MKARAAANERALTKAAKERAAAAQEKAALQGKNLGKRGASHYPDEVVQATIVHTGDGVVLRESIATTRSKRNKVTKG